MPLSICDHPLGNIIEFHEKILNPNDSDLSGHEHFLVGIKYRVPGIPPEYPILQMKVVMSGLKVYGLRNYCRA